MAELVDANMCERDIYFIMHRASNTDYPDHRKRGSRIVGGRQMFGCRFESCSLHYTLEMIHSVEIPLQHLS